MDEGNDFEADVGVELSLDIAAVERMGAFVVEAFGVDGVDGEDFDAASFDEVS